MEWVSYFPPCNSVTERETIWRFDFCMGATIRIEIEDVTACEASQQKLSMWFNSHNSLLTSLRFKKMASMELAKKRAPFIKALCFLNGVK